MLLYKLKEYQIFKEVLKAQRETSVFNYFEVSDSNIIAMVLT